MKSIIYLNYLYNRYFILALLSIINIICLSSCSQHFSSRKYHVISKGETLYAIAKKYNTKFEYLAIRNRIKSPYTLKIGKKLIIVNANHNYRNQLQHSEHKSLKPCNNHNKYIENKLSNIASAKYKNYQTNNSSIARSNKDYKGNNFIRARSNNYKNNNFASTTTINEKIHNSTIAATANVTVKPIAINNSIIKRITWAWPTQGRIIKTFMPNGNNKNNGIDIAGNKGNAVLSAASGKVVYRGNNLRGYGNLIIIKHNDDFLSAYAHNEKILVQEQQMVTRGQKIATMGNTEANQVLLHFEIRYKGKPIDPLIILGPRSIQVE